MVYRAENKLMEGTGERKEDRWKKRRTDKDGRKQKGKRRAEQGVSNGKGRE